MIFSGIKLFDNIRLKIVSHNIIVCFKRATLKRDSIKNKKRVETL